MVNPHMEITNPEELSVATAIETRKMPEEFKAQKLITDRLGADSLKGLLAAPPV